MSASVQATIDALEADGSIPAGVTVELAGVSQQQTEAFGGLFASMGVAILLVYVMMVLDLQLAHHPVHHPVQPAAGDHRRVPGPVPDRTGRSACPR